MAALLQDQLDAITARTRALVQADRLAVSERAAAELFATGIEERILPVGATAPEFALQDAKTGQMVRLSDLLALGPVVVKFFRGRWDPYCVTELETGGSSIRGCGSVGRCWWRFRRRREGRMTLRRSSMRFPSLS